MQRSLGSSHHGGAAPPRVVAQSDKVDEERTRVRLREKKNMSKQKNRRKQKKRRSSERKKKVERVGGAVGGSCAARPE
jgi:hypothetical protein